MEDKDIEILYADKDIIVCIKPEGVLSEGEADGCMPFLLSKMYGEERIYTVHRLDRETRGLMVYSKNSRSAAVISAEISERAFKKEYLAVLCGKPETKEGEIKSLLFYDRKKGKSFCVDKARKGVKEALLEYSVLGETEEYALAKIKLHTGRTHQIRVQFASEGLPLLGDRRYGAPKSEYKGIALVSHRLSFSHPSTGKSMDFSYVPKAEYPWNLFDLKE